MLALERWLDELIRMGVAFERLDQVRRTVSGWRGLQVYALRVETERCKEEEREEGSRMEGLMGIPITIVEAGAIGGTVGAYLDEAGYDVTLVDVSPEHVGAIQDRGLRITGARGERTFHPRAILAEDLRGPLRTVFLCVKGHFTEGTIRELEPLLAPDGYVLSLQNGLNESLIAEHVGEERTVGGFVHFGADLLEPGEIRLGYEATIHVGEINGRITSRYATTIRSNGRP